MSAKTKAIGAVSALALTFFGAWEFAQRGKPETADLFDPRTAVMLDSARSYSGVPYKINSAVREPDYNEAVGGAARSSHTAPCYCGVDIAAPKGKNQEVILYGLKKAGFTRFVIYPNHIHTDSDSTKPSGTWYRNY